MKYGRRRKHHGGIAARLAQLKRQHEREVREAALRRPPEHIVSIEIMCITLASFRRSDEWQALGWWGRWLALWRNVGFAECPRIFINTPVGQFEVIGDSTMPLGKIVMFRGAPPQIETRFNYQVVTGPTPKIITDV